MASCVSIMAPKCDYAILRLLFSLLWISMVSGLRLENSGASNAWTIRAGVSSEDQALRSIVSATPVNMYIRYAPSSDRTVLATLHLRGGLFMTSSRPSGISMSSPGELRVSVAPYISAVEITTHVPEQLSDIKVTSVGEVVVEQNVLVATDPHAHVTISVNGVGDVYLPPQQRFEISSLSLQGSGYGNIRLLASEITVNALDVHVLGVGDVKLHASNLVVQGSISVDVSSQGDALVSATTLRASELHVKASGPGNAIVAVKGKATSSSTVAQCDYQLLSVGEIRAGSVVCTNANVKNSGVSDITVHVTNSLAYSMSSHGRIYYVGASPSILTPSSPHDHAVKPAKHADYVPRLEWADDYYQPQHYFLTESPPNPVQMPSSPKNQPLSTMHEAPVETVGTKVKNHDPTSVETVGAKVKSDDPTPLHHFPWHLVAIAAMVVVLFMAERIWSRRQREQWPAEKERLHHEDTPVYI